MEYDLDCIHQIITHYTKSVPTGIRTPVTAVKGRCPRPLDDGDVRRFFLELAGIEPATSCMPCKRSPS